MVGLVYVGTEVDTGGVHVDTDTVTDMAIEEDITEDQVSIEYHIEV